MNKETEAGRDQAACSGAHILTKCSHSSVRKWSIYILHVNTVVLWKKNGISGARICLGSSCEVPRLQWSFEGNARIKTERRAVGISGRRSVSQNTEGDLGMSMFMGVGGYRELSWLKGLWTESSESSHTYNGAGCYKALKASTRQLECVHPAPMATSLQVTESSNKTHNN